MSLRRSLRTKMLILLLLSSLLISAGATGISYMLYKEYTINEHIRMADGVTSIVKALIDPDLVDTYLEKGFDAVGYSRIRREMSIIRENHVDVKFLYVYKIMPDGCHVVFDVDSEDVKAMEPGEIQPFDKSFMPYIDDLLAGRRIDPIISDDSYGYLLTVYEPLYDGMGRCKCYVAVDFSMNVLKFYSGVFMARLVSMFVGFFIFILTAGLYFIERGIILPVNGMAYGAGTFAYDSEEKPKHTDLIKRFKQRMAALEADETKQPWEKVSAAVGAASYRKGKDHSADEVFKRADKLMYEDKSAMKAHRTD